ncbi:hypothetical protein F652_2412 [Enterobacteriaceae bacterium bta3-1]|nr:hypothetical protein F652_2412 [Enterobacteriaceae bacterium bta3-1]
MKVQNIPEWGSHEQIDGKKKIDDYKPWWLVAGGWWLVGSINIHCKCLHNAYMAGWYADKDK